MCGFGGAINHSTNINAARVGHIAAQVRFRGPDSCGIRILNQEFEAAESGRNALFFNRLAIIDTNSRANQPFEDAEHLLVFNGEIYNYTNLKKDLQSRGVNFLTTSDTEVLFHALKKWGRDAIPKVNGMFAFFWLDKREKKFILCRDRLGIKPLYYCIRNNSFYFSSELHSIVRFSGERPEVSTASVNMYLWMQFVPTPFTILNNIFKLPPGSMLESDVNNINSNITPKIYWDAYEQVNEKKGNNNLEEILKNSVQRQMQADVPLGLFLSSGVDSSLLAAVVNKYFAKSQDVNFFTVSFSEQTVTDESADAESYIKGFKNPNLKNHLLHINAASIGERIDQLYNYYDEPFGDYASLLNWAISEKAREFVTVALSGDGADELFWGYERYNKWAGLDKINSFPFLSKTVAGAASLLPANESAMKIRRIFQHDPLKRHFELFLMPAFRSIFKKQITDFPLWALENAEKISGRKDAVAIWDLKTYLADAMLYKVDRSSMATSLEVRVPYLDNTVIDLALALPFNAKSNEKYRNKAVLKELLTRLAPHYQASKTKRGFSFPLQKWLRENWKERVSDTVNANTLTSLGLDPRPFISIVNNFYNNNSNEQAEVWYLFNLALWKQRYDGLLKDIGA